MNFTVGIENFEGPMDLLVYLVRKKEINIYNIQIARITKEFLNYLNTIKKINLDISGDFISFASLLLNIKSDSLLRKENTEEESNEMLLRERIKTYSLFQDGAEFLRKQLEVSRKESYRGTSIENQNIDIPFEIFNEAKMIIKRQKEKPYIPAVLKWQIEDFISMILEPIRTMKRYAFFKFFRGKPWNDIIAGFFALLEAVKDGKIRVSQKKIFGEIWVLRKK